MIAPAWETPRDLRHRPKALQACGLCGVRFGPKALKTKDHVIPKGFFGSPRPPNLPTWQVCKGCQQDLDPREDRLRTLFAAANSRHPNLVQSVVDKASRSTRPPKIVERRYVATDGGMFVPANTAVPRTDDLDLVFGKVARGLYYWRNHQLATDSRFVVRKLNAHGSDMLCDLVDARGAWDVQRMGAEFWWVTYLGRQQPWCLWLFNVFGAIPVAVYYGNACRELPMPPSSDIVLR